MSDHHEASIEHASDRKTLSSYVIGLALSLILTLMAFAIIEYAVIEKRIFTNQFTYAALTILAITQLIVQAVCFLRLNAKREGQWNLLPFVFTIFIAAILAGGSLWIMYNLNYNMMN